VLALYYNAQLRVSAAEETAVVDVGRTYQCYLIVDDHQFAVDVDDFSDGLAVEHGVGPEAKEVEIIVEIVHFPQPMVHVVDIFQMKIHLDSEYC
jgi:hypothetical protein